MLSIEAILYYKDRPVEFVKDIIGATPDDIQGDILTSVSENQLTSVRSGHGIGKSALQSWLIYWFMCTRPFPKIPCTAPTKHQLHDILWAEVAKWRTKAIQSEIEWTQEKLYMKSNPENWFAVPRTATQPDALQGFHADHLLYIIDEASGVKDVVFEPVLGSLSTQDAKLIMCGNPTQLSGFFFDSHNKNRSIYSTFKVSGENSKRVSKDYVQMIIDMYGLDSDVYRVRVAGEFPKAMPDSFIQLDWVEDCSLKVPNRTYPVDRIDIGVDVARYGDDETIINPLFDKKYQQRPVVMYHNDTMQVTGQIVSLVERYRQEYIGVPIHIKIDCDGLGVGVYDRLKEIKKERNWVTVKLYECHFGGAGGKNKKEEPVEFSNSTGLMWGLLREKLKRKEIELIYDDKQITQLSNRKYRINSDGKIELERKEEMKKRGLTSPDRRRCISSFFI
ncbi:MAG: terminase [Clostridia bacterium]|nr:terminase [Clostridia bacterium]